MKTIPHIKTQPAYAAAMKERDALAIALGKVNGRIEEIESLLRASSVTAQERDSSHVAAALHFARTGEVKGADNTPTALQEEHAILRQQREALENAMRVRTEALGAITDELSAQLGRDLELKHRKLAGRYVAVLKQLDALYAEEQDLVDEVQSAGYRPRFREYIRWPLLGRLSQRSESNLWTHLRDFEHYAAE